MSTEAKTEITPRCTTCGSVVDATLGGFGQFCSIDCEHAAPPIEAYPRRPGRDAKPYEWTEYESDRSALDAERFRERIDGRFSR